ncbi:unnamed protein product [Urochloa decumbens]|uniref:Late embryogenesis abundant protein LEA-2 subgroup domain-containing protein n=1 Tax=Urochloa decumbens TaxID=240449 RepID=A0ABC8YUC6_9POAL
MDEAEYQQLPAAAKGDSSDHAAAAAAAPKKKKDDDCPAIVMALLWLLLALGIAANVYGLKAGFDSTPDPRLFVRLVAAQGLGVNDQSAPPPPTFELAVDVDRIPEEASYRGALDVGGGGAMLRVSYRGAILAWGTVPRFTIDVRRLGRSASGVATVVARAEGSVLRREMRDMIRAELRAFGRVEFDVDGGKVPSLGGHLRCKTYLFRGEPTLALPPCWVQKRPNH